MATHIEIEGEWLYVYKGREIMCVDFPEKKDPFASVTAVRLKDITGLTSDHQTRTFSIHVKGFTCPILCEFGFRNPYRINCHGAALCKLGDVLGLSREYIWGLDRRDEQTAEASRRADEGGHDSD